MTETCKDKPRPQELERYRIRFGLYKVIAGTMIVGLAGVLIPGAVQFWEVQAERTRQQEEYVRSFLGTALDQDIELRIRFADYFANVAPSKAKQDWIEYRDSLVESRNEARKKIRTREEEIRLASLEDKSDPAIQIKIAQLERELDWLYGETGYIEKDRSILVGPTESKKKEELLSSIIPNVLSLDQPTDVKYEVYFLKGNYKDRQLQANDKCIAYVEQHFNSSTSPNASYSVVSVASSADELTKSWGRSYSKAVATSYGTRVSGNDGILVGGWNSRADGNLGNLTIPGILVEPLFTSNPLHADIIRSISGQRALASILSKSIWYYFPEGGNICFSVGHKYKESNPNDRGSALVGGGTEADYAEKILERAKIILEGSET